jgi:putative membrane protein
MDFASLDLLLAILHHLLVFSLAGILAYEIAAIRSGMTGADAARVAKVDLWYGVLAGLIIAVGFSRAVFAAKGWDYYADNHYFWGKMIAFALVGALSAMPTMALFKWRRAAAKDPVFMPNEGDIAHVRRVLRIEAGVFALIPVFAAAMARGS